LLFVQRTLILLQCGNAVVADALLGRFLPRLGPLVATQAASLFLPPSDALKSTPGIRLSLSNAASSWLIGYVSKIAGPRFARPPSSRSTKGATDGDRHHQWNDEADRTAPSSQCYGFSPVFVWAPCSLKPCFYERAPLNPPRLGPLPATPSASSFLADAPGSSAGLKSAHANESQRR
jgi:hypothetical protein